MAYSVIGFVPGSRPAYLRRRTSDGRAPAGRDLVVEQAAERPEHELVQAEIRDLELFRQLGTLDRVGRGLDQDLQVLLDAWVGLGRESTEPACACTSRVAASCRSTNPGDRSLIWSSNPSTPNCDGGLGLEFGHQLDHQPCILVALLDPVGNNRRRRLGRRLGLGRRDKGERDECGNEQTTDDQARQFHTVFLIYLGRWLETGPMKSPRSNDE